MCCLLILLILQHQFFEKIGAVFKKICPDYL